MSPQTGMFWQKVWGLTKYHSSVLKAVSYRSLCSILQALLPGSVSNVCPMCAAVAYYCGPEFTVNDIPTGYQARLLLEGAPPTPLARPLSANVFHSLEGRPRAVLQLHPQEEGDAEGCTPPMSRVAGVYAFDHALGGVYASDDAPVRVCAFDDACGGVHACFNAT
eukprot:gene17908-21322_t